MSPHDFWYRFEKIPPYGLYRISWQVLIVAPLPKNQINKKPKKISHVISCLSTVTFHLATTRVSKSHGRVTAQNSSDFAQNLEICMRKQKIYAFQPRLQFFFIHVSHILCDCQWIFVHFVLHKVSILRFWPRKKNLLLECLATTVCSFSSNESPRRFGGPVSATSVFHLKLRPSLGCNMDVIMFKLMVAHLKLSKAAPVSWRPELQLSCKNIHMLMCFWKYTRYAEHMPYFLLKPKTCVHMVVIIH